MIDFDAYYVHRKKGFIVVVGEPAWWDVLRRGPIPEDPVVVMRCGLTSGPSKWLMKRSSFERTYEKENAQPPTKKRPGGSPRSL